MKVMCIGVLMLPVSEKAMNVGFADDLTVIIAAKHPEDLKVYVTETVKTENRSLKKAVERKAL